MEETAIKAECRLYALEWAVAQLWAAELRKTGAAPETLAGVRGQAIGGARQLGFTGVDPATSDLLSAELEGAVDRMFMMVAALVGTSPDER